MEVRKITGISPDDRAAVEQAFAEINPCHIACCNWPGEFPYAPEVSFRMFHTGDWLLLRFDVAENYTAALVTEDNGQVWTDSCVEFFIAPDEGCTTISKPPASGGCFSRDARRGTKTCNTPRRRCWQA